MEEEQPVFSSKSDWAPFHITSPLSQISSLHLTVNSRSGKHLHKGAEITDLHLCGTFRHSLSTACKPHAFIHTQGCPEQFNCLLTLAGKAERGSPYTPLSAHEKESKQCCNVKFQDMQLSRPATNRSSGECCNSTFFQN